jgi:hypothetical protein
MGTWRVHETLGSVQLTLYSLTTHLMLCTAYSVQLDHPLDARTRLPQVTT